MKIFYFGCVDRRGHYMHAPAGDPMSGRDLHYVLRTNPWGLMVDGGLCPKGEQKQGSALIHQRDGWTALSFWDRSIDRRQGSSSTYIAEGTHDFAAMINLASDHFPHVMRRYEFPIVEVSAVPA